MFGIKKKEDTIELMKKALGVVWQGCRGTISQKDFVAIATVESLLEAKDVEAIVEAVEVSSLKCLPSASATATSKSIKVAANEPASEEEGFKPLYRAVVLLRQIYQDDFIIASVLELPLDSGRDVLKALVHKGLQRNW